MRIIDSTYQGMTAVPAESPTDATADVSTRIRPFVRVPGGPR
jgi:hypothetical protein